MTVGIFFSDDFFLGPRLDKIFKDAFATILENNLILRLVSKNVFVFNIKPLVIIMINSEYYKNLMLSLEEKINFPGCYGWW